MGFQAAVAEALTRVQAAVAEECRQVLAAAADLELRLQQEAAQVTEHRRQLEERAKQLELEYQARREELELEVKEKAALVAGERMRLEGERAELARGTGPDDVISLSLGGERYVDVKRATLCQYEDSLFGAMFSGRWDQQLERDQAGRVLLDFNPALIMPLLDHLRVRRCALAGLPVPTPKAPPGMEAEFRQMLGYYGMDCFVMEQGADAMDEDRAWSWDQLKSSSPGGQRRVFSEDLREVEACGSSPIFGSVEFDSGCHTWAVKLLSGNYVCVGVGTLDTRQGMGQPYGGSALVYDCWEGHLAGALRVAGLETAHREDIIGVRLDVTSSTVTFFKNGCHLAHAPLTALRSGPYIPIMGLWGGVGNPSRARLVSTTSVQ